MKDLFLRSFDNHSLFYKLALHFYKQRTAIIPNVFKDSERGKPRVGLSYMLLPFQMDENDPKFLNHSNLWRNRCIAEIFREMGYIVDAIDARNQFFQPLAKYDVYFDDGWNLERLKKRLPVNCTKIFFGTTLHWLDRNRLEFTRLNELMQRRNVLVPPKRINDNFQSDLLADAVVLIGNRVMRESYRHINKPVYQVSISVPEQLIDDHEKTWQKARRNFLWIGGGGCVHKGLDLVLEAFAKMPEFSLHVFGSANKEPEFEKAFHTELYGTENIKYHGYVDVASRLFSEICRECSALIYPSAGEATGNVNLISMAKGIIPIISSKCAVDVDGAGVVLPDCSIQTICSTVRDFAALSEAELEQRSCRAREIVRTRHTRDGFRAAMSDVLGTILEQSEDPDHRCRKTTTTIPRLEYRA